MTATCPVWVDRDGSRWQETGNDRLRVVTFEGVSVPLSDPFPRSEVDRRWGPLTAEVTG